MNSLNRWKSAGIITIIISGFLLHYLFSWTGNSKVIGWLVPVNESVWEHLKLGYWSVVLFSSAEYVQIKHRVHNYFLAKTTGVLALEATIIIIYYGYTFIAGKDILILDIFSFVLGTVCCQHLTYIFLRMKPFSVRLKWISAAAFIAIGVLFGITTYYPPHTELFKDSNNNTFGINKEK